MSTPTRVEVEDVHWFAGFGPVEIGGECNHDCEHRDLTVIAWGPSLLHYELVLCVACHCRAWQAALPGTNGGIWDSHPFLCPGGGLDGGTRPSDRCDVRAGRRPGPTPPSGDDDRDTRRSGARPAERCRVGGGDGACGCIVEPW